MGGLPLGAGAVVVVRVHLVIVHVHSRQQGRPRRTTHGGRNVRVPELGPLVSDGFQRLRHEIQRAQLHVLVVCQDQHDVRLVVAPRGGDRRKDRRFSLSVSLGVVTVYIHYSEH